MPKDPIENIRKRLMAKLRRVKRWIRFGEDIKALFRYIRDPRIPASNKALVVRALLYFILIFDAVPDFLGIPGFADDAVVIAGVVAYLGTALGPYRNGNGTKERRST